MESGLASSATSRKKGKTTNTGRAKPKMGGRLGGIVSFHLKKPLISRASIQRLERQEKRRREK